tara:strand:+ start:907 stop:8763 length:7857 start_codon:yes stop_codon:yes gene_type:complete
MNKIYSSDFNYDPLENAEELKKRNALNQEKENTVEEEANIDSDLWKTDPEAYVKSQKDKITSSNSNTPPDWQTDSEAYVKWVKDNPGAGVVEDSEEVSISGTDILNFTQPGLGQAVNTPQQESLPPIDLEKFEEGNYTVDPKKFAIQELGLSQEDADNWAKLQEGIDQGSITPDQETKIQSKADLLFPPEGGISNLNPEGLKTQENTDAEGNLIGIALKNAPGAAGLFSNTAGNIAAWGKEKIEKIRTAIGGEESYISNETQKNIDNQIDFKNQAEESLKLQIKNGDIENYSPEDIVKEAKKLYTTSLEQAQTEKNITEFSKSLSSTKTIVRDGKEREIEKGLLDTSRDQEAIDLKEIADVWDSSLDEKSKQLITETKALQIKIETVNTQLENAFKNAEKNPPKNKEEYLALKSTVESLNKTRNQYLSLGEKYAKQYDFVVNNSEEVKEFGGLIGRNYNGIARVGALVTSSTVSLGLGVEEYANSIAMNLKPAALFKNIVLPAAKWAGVDSMTQNAVVINAALEAMPPLPSGGFLSIAQSEEYQKQREKVISVADSFSTKLTNSVGKQMNYADIKDASDWGSWALDFAATQGPQLGLMIALPGVALPLLGMSSGGSKIRDMRLTNKLGSTNYTEMEIMGAGTVTAIGEVVSERLSMGQLKRLKIKNMPINRLKTSFTSRLKNNVFNINKLKAVGYDVNEEGVGEMFAKFSENLADKYIAGKDVNLYDGMEEAYVGGIFMSGVMMRAPTIGNAILAPFKTKSLNLKFDQNALNISNLSSQLGKNITPKNRDLITNKIQDLAYANAEIRVDQAMATDYLAQPQKNELIKIYQQEITNKKDIESISNDKNIDDAAKSEIITGLEIENNNLAQQREAIMEPAIKANYEQTTENVKNIAQDIDGVSVTEIDDVNQENINRQKRNNEKLSLAEANGQSADSVKVEKMIDADLPGSFNPDTGEIIINKAAALKNKQVNVAAHELLHGIMGQTFKGNPTAQKAFGESVISELGKYKNIGGAKFASRLGQYQKAVESGDITEADAYEESMNLLSDAIATKDINLPETFLQKIGKLITGAASKLGWKTSFNNGSDVVGFIKNFNKQVAEGELSDKTLNVAKEGATGKLTKPAAKTAKTSDKASLPTVKGVDATKVKDMVGKVANRAVAKYYRGIPKNIREKAGLDRTTYLDSAKTELAQIAQKYDSTKKDKDGNQVSFERYMANTGMQRLNALATKLGVESSEQGVTQSLDSPQAQQIADTTTETETDTSENQRTLNPESILPKSKATNDFLKDTKTELEKLSTAELSNIRYNTSQSVAKDAFAAIFNVPVNKIFNKADNFKKGEAASLQRFILQNAAKLSRLLPEGNAPVREVSAKKGGKKVKRGGEGVALPRKLQDTFYSQLKTPEGKPRKIDSESGKQSIQYRKRPDISQTQFLEAFGIKNGKVDPNFTPRSGEAQAIKGIMEIAARNVTNLAARQEIDTRNITETEAITAKQKMGEGRSRLMFSFAEISASGKQLRDSLNLFGEVGDLTVGQNLIDFINSKNGTNFKALPRKQFAIKGKNGKTKKVGRYVLTSQQKIARRDFVRGLAESGNFPKSFFNSVNFSSTGLKYSSSLYSSVAELNADLEGVVFKDVPNKRATRTKYNKLTPSGFKKLSNTQNFKDNEARKMPYLKQITKGIESDLKNNPENIVFWTAVMRDTQDGSSSFLRALAPISFYSKVNGPLREEHSMPASSVGNFLLTSAALGQVDTNFDFVNKNYFQGGLLIVDDNKLKSPYFNYVSSMPAAFYTMKNITTWARYNNPNVASVDGGINFANYQMIGKANTVLQEIAEQGMDIAVANIKVENVKEKGKEAVKNDPNLKPSLPDPTQLDTDINNMIQDTKGIDARKRFSDIVAKRRGSGFKGARLIAAGAQDFGGLMYDLYGKGKLGEKQQKWVKENLVSPYSKGVANIDNYRQTLKNDYSSLLKKFPEVRKKLGKLVPGTDFTHDQALRVNLWTKGGFEIPGISKRDAKKLNDFIAKSPELNLFNDSALLISKQDKWVEPSPHWDVESLISDLNNLTNKVGRKQYLAEFIKNKDVIFSKENLNKMEVALGTNWREAMEDSLYRMENGTNRPSGTNKLTNQFNNWVNNSIGAIMFFNRKSALLQTISAVNFLNWSDNNPFKAALAFGNQPQYWSDFAKLWNSPKLKQRRSGLRKDVNEAEIANAAKGSKNKAQAILSYLLKIGFTPTQLADSFAIASGGSTFYRNRANTYIKQGMNKVDAEAKAFEDFSETSDVSQQSADPMLISQQQAGVLGRLLLAFQNTPAQVTRIFNKSARDFINGRGDQKTNVSKMIYYGAVQGLIFATLQNALFAVVPGFDEEDDEEKRAQTLDKKKSRILNSMVDTMLRGSGVYGAIFATLKNTINTYFVEEAKKPFSKDHRNTLLEALNLSPPIGSKLRKMNNAIKTKEYEKDVINQQGYDVTIDGKVNLSPTYSVIGSLVEAITNLPLERAIVEINSLVEALDSRNTTFQRIALALGYRTWDVGTKNEERDQIKIEAKETKKEAQKQKVIDAREERKRLEEEKRFEGMTEEEIVVTKRKDVIFKESRSDQIKSLLDLGLTKKEIKGLKYEEDRVNKIIELQNKNK